MQRSANSQEVRHGGAGKDQAATHEVSLASW